MSVLDTATLIYVPGFYKTSAVALQKPISAGSVSSLTFARSGATSTVLGSDGLIQSRGANLARIDFTDACGKQLLEPARTNLMTHSEQFDNAAWTKGSGGAGSVAVVTANAGVAPDGNSTADRITFVAPASGDRSFISQSATTTAAIDYAGGAYVKAWSPTDVGKIIVYRHAGNATYSTITLTDEWQRVAGIENAASTTSTLSFELIPSQGSSTGTVDILIWGAQLEAGSYATTYIPTVASTVTRTAETISQTGLAAQIGDSEGTIIFELSGFSTSETGYFVLSDGTNANRVLVGIRNDGQLEGALVRGGVSEAAIIGSTYSANVSVKLAVAYETNRFVLYKDGVKIGEDLTVTTFADATLTRADFSNPTGFQQVYGKVSALHLWDTALTDSQLAELTS